MTLKKATFFPLLALPSLCACQCTDKAPGVGSRLIQQPVEIVHYGDDGALARIEGKDSLYGVIFDPDCENCEATKKAIEPQSALDVSLCEFRIIVSGDVEKGRRELGGTLRVKRIDQQPDAEAAHQQGEPRQPCKQPLSNKAATVPIV